MREAMGTLIDLGCLATALEIPHSDSGKAHAVTFQTHAWRV
jgi:hypothetical protein